MELLIFLIIWLVTVVVGLFLFKKNFIYALYAHLLWFVTLLILSLGYLINNSFFSNIGLLLLGISWAISLATLFLVFINRKKENAFKMDEEKFPDGHVFWTFIVLFPLAAISSTYIGGDLLGYKWLENLGAILFALLFVYFLYIFLKNSKTMVNKIIDSANEAKTCPFLISKEQRQLLVRDKEWPFSLIGAAAGALIGGLGSAGATLNGVSLLPLGIVIGAIIFFLAGDIIGFAWDRRKSEPEKLNICSVKIATPIGCILGATLGVIAFGTTGGVLGGIIGLLLIYRVAAGIDRYGDKLSSDFFEEREKYLDEKKRERVERKIEKEQNKEQRKSEKEERKKNETMEDETETEEENLDLSDTEEDKKPKGKKITIIHKEKKVKKEEPIEPEKPAEPEKTEDIKPNIKKPDSDKEPDKEE